MTDEQVREMYGEYANAPHVDKRIADRHELLGQGVNIDDDGDDAVACDWCGEGCPIREMYIGRDGEGPGHRQFAEANGVKIS